MGCLSVAQIPVADASSGRSCSGQGNAPSYEAQARKPGASTRPTELLEFARARCGPGATGSAVSARALHLSQPQLSLLSASHTPISCNWGHSISYATEKSRRLAGRTRRFSSQKAEAAAGVAVLNRMFDAGCRGSVRRLNIAA